MEKVIKNKFHDGKIYAIRSYQTDKIYIGSTCSKLTSRLLYHQQYKRRNDRTGEHNVAANIIICYDDHYIELLEKFKCENKEELEQREKEHIRQNINICVNKVIVGRTNKEYYNDNKNAILTHNKIYRDAHKDEIKKYYEENKEKLTKQKAEIIKCVCGKDTTQGNKARHEKSKIHLSYISSQPAPAKEPEKEPAKEPVKEEAKEPAKEPAKEESSSSESSDSSDESIDEDNKTYKPSQEQQERIECAKLRILGYSRTQKQHARYDELRAKFANKN